MTYEPNGIYLADAYKAIKELPDNSVDCIYTDIPYLYVDGGMGKSALGARMKQKRNDYDDICKGVDLSILEEFMRVMKRVNCFVWCSNLQLYEIMDYFHNKDVTQNLLVWCKTNPSPTTNNIWLPDLEYCLHFRGHGVRLNDGYDLKSKYFVSPINKTDKDRFEHATIKPLTLVERHIAHATQPNDIVLDPFSGSGTTAVAAKNLGRRYIGFEINEQWAQIAQNRLANQTAGGQMSFLTL